MTRLQEILKARGIADADIEAIMGEMKQSKIFITSHENMDVRYPKLKKDHDDLTIQHGESTKLIEQLKNGAENSEAMQSKITSYEQQIAKLQAELTEAQVVSAAKLALINAGATDVGYALYKLQEKGKLELDDKGEIKGIDDMLAGLKTQAPAAFGGANGQAQVVQHKLPPHDQGSGAAMTRAEFLRKPYPERAAFQAENPEEYKTIMNQ